MDNLLERRANGIRRCLGSHHKRFASQQHDGKDSAD
jgi:hypothetical protein